MDPLHTFPETTRVVPIVQTVLAITDLQSANDAGRLREVDAVEAVALSLVLGKRICHFWSSRMIQPKIAPARKKMAAIT